MMIVSLDHMIWLNWFCSLNTSSQITIDSVMGHLDLGSIGETILNIILLFDPNQTT